MKEDIIHGNYKDPMELDEFALNRISDFGNDVETLFEGSLKESTIKYMRKKQQNLENSDLNAYEYSTSRGYREVQGLKEPWTEDQSFIWPDYEAEAFEKTIESFRKRPESNTGYKNKALNDKMITWFGKQAKDCIENKLIKK